MLNSIQSDSTSIQLYLLLAGSTTTRHGWGAFIPVFGIIDRGIPPCQGEFRPVTLTQGKIPGGFIDRWWRVTTT
ncbi:MAG: hypothetical protein ACFFCQ_12300 [Promethearchaeota archaeon]